MKRKYLFMALAVLMTILFMGEGVAGVDPEIKELLKLDEPPLDIAIDLGGRWIYVLTSEGKLNIYDSSGKFEDAVTVGKHITGIQVGPWENKLFLTSRDNKTVQTLSLTFQQEINISGAPFKGPVDAEVVIVAFDDFQ